MTTVVFLLLALVWGALLVSWLRSRSTGTLSDSVHAFRKNLNVLERTAPATVIPANRLRGGTVPLRSGASMIGGLAGRPPAMMGSLGRPGRAPLAASSAALRRRSTQRRRRDVFFALVAGASASLAVALLPGMSIMWAVQVLFDVALGSYVAMLIRIRNLAAEREMKLHRMPVTRTASARRPRRSYDFGAYGDLDLRRAVN